MATENIQALNYSSCNGFNFFSNNSQQLMNLNNYLITFNNDDEDLLIYSLNKNGMSDYRFQSMCELSQPLFTADHSIPFVKYNEHIESDWKTFLRGNSSVAPLQKYGAYSLLYTNKQSYIYSGNTSNSSLFQSYMYFTCYLTLAIIAVKVAIQCINMHKLETQSMSNSIFMTRNESSKRRKVVQFIQRYGKSFSMILILCFSLHLYIYNFIWEIVKTVNSLNKLGSYSELELFISYSKYKPGNLTTLLNSILLLNHALLNLIPIIKKRFPRVDFFTFIVVWSILNVTAAVLQYNQLEIIYYKPSFLYNTLIAKFGNLISTNITENIQFEILQKAMILNSRTFSRAFSFSVFVLAIKMFLMSLYSFMVIVKVFGNSKSFFIDITIINKNYNNNKVFLRVLNPKATILSLSVISIHGSILAMVAIILVNSRSSDVFNLIEPIGYLMGFFTFDIHTEYMIILNRLDNTTRVNEEIIKEGNLQWADLSQEINNITTKDQTKTTETMLKEVEYIDDLDQWDTESHEISRSVVEKKLDINTYIYEQID